MEQKKVVQFFTKYTKKLKQNKNSYGIVYSRFNHDYSY